MATDPAALGPFARAYLEPGMPIALVDFIAAHADEVAHLVARAGVADGAWNCYAVTAVWQRCLHVGGIAALRLEGEYREAGGIGHAWLAIGEDLWLFDPTAAQFRTKFDLAKYIVDPAEGYTFRGWRRDERAARA